MRDMYISDSILYVGADDKTLDIFESQYPIPNGVSYNSYVILDEKVAVMDTVDKRATDTWFENLCEDGYDCRSSQEYKREHVHKRIHPALNDVTQNGNSQNKLSVYFHRN